MQQKQKIRYYRPIFPSKLNSPSIDFLRNQTNKEIINSFLLNNKEKIFIDPEYDKKIKIVVYTPPISPSCGGIMVLYNLLKTINDLEHENILGLVYTYDNKQHKNPFCNSFFNPLLVDDNTFVIYPETITGNPLNCKNVIRWILLDLGIEVPKNQYKSWDKNDIVYHWEPSSLKNSKQLVNIYINPEIKKYNHKKRNINSYAFKKMQWLSSEKLNKQKIHYYHNRHDINIDDIKNTKKIIDVLNHSKKFYCYDPNTFFSIMAPLCGSITVLHPFNNMTKKEYINARILAHPSGFHFDAGLAYDNTKEEIELALSTVNKAQEQFDHLIYLYKQTVLDFMQQVEGVLSSNTSPINTVKNIYY